MTLLKHTCILITNDTSIFQSLRAAKQNGYPMQACRRHLKVENSCITMSKSTSMRWEENAARTRGDIHTNFWLKNAEKTKPACKTNAYMGGHYKASHKETEWDCAAVY